MIIQELITANNGRKLMHVYSNKGYNILRDGEFYHEVLDIPEEHHEYKEIIPIQEQNSEK